MGRSHRPQVGRHGAAPGAPRSSSGPARHLAFTALPDPDTYAPQVGFSDGFPAARDPVFGRAWLVNCYGMVGAARGDNVDSGGGTALYAIIGGPQRQLGPQYHDGRTGGFGNAASLDPAARQRSAGRISGSASLGAHRVGPGGLGPAGREAHAHSRYCAPTRRPSPSMSRRCAIVADPGSRCLRAVWESAQCPSLCGPRPSHTKPRRARVSAMVAAGPSCYADAVSAAFAAAASASSDAGATSAVPVGSSVGVAPASPSAIAAAACAAARAAAAGTRGSSGGSPAAAAAAGT